MRAAGFWRALAFHPVNDPGGGIVGAHSGGARPGRVVQPVARSVEGRPIRDRPIRDRPIRSLRRGRPRGETSGPAPPTHRVGEPSGVTWASAMDPASPDEPPVGWSRRRTSAGERSSSRPFTRGAGGRADATRADGQTQRGRTGRRNAGGRADATRAIRLDESRTSPHHMHWPGWTTRNGPWTSTGSSVHYPDLERGRTATERGRTATERGERRMHETTTSCGLVAIRDPRYGVLGLTSVPDPGIVRGVAIAPSAPTTPPHRPPSADR